MQKLLTAVVACALASACVPKEQYTSKALEAEELGRKYKDEQERAKSCEDKVTAQEAKTADVEKRRAELEAKAAELEQKIADIGNQLTDKEAERRALLDQNTKLTALNDELSKSSKKLAEAKAELEKRSSEYESLAHSLKEEIKNGQIELTELKGKMTVKLKDKVLFASGSTKIDKGGTNALTKIASTLKTVKGKVIRVEGHTDNVPLGTKGEYANNWELSTARALAVVKVLIDAGVDPTKVSAGGYGEYQPVAPNSTPENRSLNRRIEIVLAAAK